MSGPPLVDLTLTLRSGMRGVAIEQAKRLERDGWNARQLHLYSHAGTHMDAQSHFGAGTETIDQHTPQRCMGPAWVADVLDVQPRQVIEVADLGKIADELRPGESLLLRTGWSRHVDNLELYRNQMPRLAEGFARWLVDRGVKLLGVEPPSVADVNDLDELTRIHQILLAGGVTIVEGLTNLHMLTQPRVYFVALPLKIADGDGCPVRAIAFDGLPEPGMWPL